MRIKRFNEGADTGTIKDIMNIARDEGLLIYEPSNKYPFNKFYIISRYYECRDLNDPRTSPIMGKDKFLDIINEIYHRLDW